MPIFCGFNATPPAAAECGVPAPFKLCAGLACCPRSRRWHSSRTEDGGGDGVVSPRYRLRRRWQWTSGPSELTANPSGVSDLGRRLVARREVPGLFQSARHPPSLLMAAQRDRVVPRHRGHRRSRLVERWHQGDRQAAGRWRGRVVLVDVDRRSRGAGGPIAERAARAGRQTGYLVLQDNQVWIPRVGGQRPLRSVARSLIRAMPCGSSSGCRTHAGSWRCARWASGHRARRDRYQRRSAGGAGGQGSSAPFLSWRDGARGDNSRHPERGPN